MAERNSNSGSSSSSIALLQERFKQLQRAREVRKERELLKELTASKRAYCNVHHEASRLPISSEYLCQASAQYAAQNQETSNLQVSRTPMYANLPYIVDTGMNGTTAYGNDDGSDVDTSLHL